MTMRPLAGGHAPMGHAEASGAANGHVALVLHAHLPFVRHPEHERHLEERWLYEALIECYLPILDVYDRLTDEGSPFAANFTCSLLRVGYSRAR